MKNIQCSSFLVFLLDCVFVSEVDSLFEKVKEDFLKVLAYYVTLRDFSISLSLDKIHPIERI